MELNQNQYELTSFGIKVIVIVIAAAVISTATFFALNSGKSNVVKLENLPFYDSATKAVVLSNNTASLSGYQNCDIYVSGPTKNIKYFETVNCDSLSSTEISKQDLLNMFGGQTGTYTVIIYSEPKSQGSILQFSIM